VGSTPSSGTNPNRAQNERVTMERGTRVIGMAAALVVAAFVLVFVALLAPSTRSWSVVIGIAYIVAAAVVLLAPRVSAGYAATATAVVTGLFALVAFGNKWWTVSSCWPQPSSKPGLRGPC
jgi:hypothetical protein